MPKNSNTDPDPKPQCVQTDVSKSVIQKQVNLHTYNDAISARYTNRRISLHKKESNKNELSFIRIAEKGEDLETPTCSYEVHRGKVLVTKLQMSNEALEVLHIIIGRYLREVSETVC